MAFLDKFRLIWNSIMIVINLAFIICSSLRLFIIIEPVTIPVMTANNVTLFVLQAICFVDMIMRFNTGYLDCESELVELNRRKITWAYIRSFCVPDLLSCVPVSFLMLLARKRSHYDYLIPDILPLARVVRIITVNRDLNTLLRKLKNSYTWYHLGLKILLFTLAIHCFSCLLFVPFVFFQYVYGEVPKTYTGFLDTHNCVKGMFVAVAAVFNSGSESMLIKEPNPSWRSRVCRVLRSSIMISESHPLAYEYLRSFPALIAERQRHFFENKNIIHPLSSFSLIWNSIMIIINLSFIICSSLRLFIIIEPVTIPVMTANDVTLFVLQAICFVDMIMRFNTGYLDCESALVELNRRRITWAYIRSFCLPDLLSCVPVSFLMLLARKRSHYDYLIPDILPLARAVRIITVTEDLNTLLRTLTNSYIWYRLGRQILLFTLAIHCFTCLLFVPSVFLHYVYGEVPKTYTGFLDTHNVSRNFLDVPYSDRYVKGMFVAVSAFFSTGFNLFTTQESGEIIVNAAILLFGTMFKVYTIVFALRIYLTLYNSTLKYQELMDQVEKYMRHQQFPAALTRRLRDFYSYSFQEHYYKESAALGCLSAHLKNEIRLHTFQTWIAKVPVLHDLPPSVLGRLMGCLESEVYMPNDLLFHIGDVGIDLYFICTGTMVLYSMRGVEMYHFEDGDFFGALALMTAGNRRMTTLVAIEITHVYRLSYDNLRELGPDLYERIKTTTLKRFAKIMKVDKLRNLEELPGDKEPQHS